MREDNFQELKIFEENQVNIYCDLLSNEVYNITGKKPHVVGSVAKMFSGTLPEDYTPKDVDFAIDNISFRKILHHHQNRNPLFGFSRMVETRPERFIIYLDDKCIELWNFFYKNYNEKLEYHKNKIPFLWQ